MMTDTIADMLTRIRNAQMRGSDSVEMPHSKTKEAIAKVLADNGYIIGSKTFKIKDTVHKGLHIDLKYDDNNEPSIRHMQRVSKPGLRKYQKANELKPVLNHLGLYVVSTPQGVMSSKEARKRKLGGELMCIVY